MKNSIKTSAFILLTFSVVSLLLASCQKKGISKWECVPFTHYTIDLTYDENAEMAFVKIIHNASEYSDTYPHFCFQEEDTLLRIGDYFYRIELNGNFIDNGQGLAIVRYDKDTLVLEEFGHIWPADLNPVIREYRFYRKD